MNNNHSDYFCLLLASLPDTPAHKPKRAQKNSYLHVCCTPNQTPLNSNDMLKEQVNGFLNHTILCAENACGSSFCNCFQTCLYHSFTCNKQSTFFLKFNNRRLSEMFCSSISFEVFKLGLCFPSNNTHITHSLQDFHTFHISFC